MTFDNSRNTFNPWNDYLGVVMQQGRVHLDSDWNELLAEFTRRIHAGSLDVIGLSGVPSTTPLAFQITPSTDTSGQFHLSIGVGRMYVDGILVQNHGLSSAPQWDPLLGETSSASPVDFTAQPYAPGAVLPATTTGPYLVYLDVWQRDVNYIEDPTLVDQAVGVESTGRLQTVWQVKLLDVSAVPGGVAATTPDAGIWNETPVSAPGAVWQTLINGSPSQLSNGTVGASGYTGQENQLYRVEIHQGGNPVSSSTPPATYPFAPGTATFKWSRENASVTTAVTAISSVTNSLGNTASQLTVTSLGRDGVLGFNPGDWIEITDDYLFLNTTAGQFGDTAPAGNASSMQSGELHQIDSINAAALTITLDAPVTVANFPLTGGLTTPSRNTRITRWDQTGTVYMADGQTVWANWPGAGSAGTINPGIPVPPLGTPLLLENGVTVTFGLSNNSGSFQTGDYWSFAARSADGSIQPLANAFPAGIDHHVCRLAILNFASSPPLVDCRTIFQALANPAVHVTGITPNSGAQLVSGSTLTVQDLSQGITVSFDSPIDPSVALQTGAIVSVSAEVPDATNTWFNTITFAGQPLQVGSATARTINWLPAQPANVSTFASAGASGLLARLSLKGNMIWALGAPNVFLNGANGGVGDGRPYADYDLWFNLISQPPVVLSASSLSFGPQLVGTPSSVLPITLTNNSTEVVTFTGTGINVTGPNAADFVVTNTGGASVTGGGNCTINVQFNPSAQTPLLGTRTASFSVAATIDGVAVGQAGAGSPPPTVTLTGTALQAAISVSSSSLGFPPTVVNQTSTMTVYVSNPGTAPLSISSISIAGVLQLLEPALDAAKATSLTPSTAEIKPAAQSVATAAPAPAAAAIGTIVFPVQPGEGDFTQTNPLVPAGGSGTLGANGGQFAITVAFTPSATGARAAQLVIANSAGQVNIPLSGTGIFEIIRINPVIGRTLL